MRAYRMDYLSKDKPSGISAREQVMFIFGGFILVKDSESSIPSEALSPDQRP